jgi:micrococcal nuclease
MNSRAWAIAVVVALQCQVSWAGASHAIDGDTIDVSGERIRILNIDTPEIHHAHCDAERRLGLVARERMTVLLASGALTLKRGDGHRMKDRHGRTLARVFVDGKDVGGILIAENLARPWEGKRRSWCD